MKADSKFYIIVKKIHLYTSLSIVTILVMYIVTSFMMMYHDYFPVERQEETITIPINSQEINDENWDSFLNDHEIQGRLVWEKLENSGNLIRKYEKIGSNYLVTILKNKDSIRIKSTNLNLSGKIIGFHRMRGYGGGFQYNLYALLLDLTGVSLIIFAITGIILWLNILNHNKTAWSVLILGLVYVASIIVYIIFI